MWNRLISNCDWRRVEVSCFSTTTADAINTAKPCRVACDQSIHSNQYLCFVCSEDWTTRVATCPRKDCPIQSISPNGQLRKVQILKRPTRDNQSPDVEKSCEPTLSSSTVVQSQTCKESCASKLLVLVADQSQSYEVSCESTLAPSMADQSQAYEASCESTLAPSMADQSQSCDMSCKLTVLPTTTERSQSFDKLTLLPSSSDQSQSCVKSCESTLLSSRNVRSCLSSCESISGLIISLSAIYCSSSECLSHNYDWFNYFISHLFKCVFYSI